jgi:hypothetical protein
MRAVMTSLHSLVANDSVSEEQIVLPVEAILRLKAEYEADVRLLEELPARIKLKKRKYEAALMFAPPGFDPNAPVIPAPRVRRRLELEEPAPTPAPTSPPKADFELVAPESRGGKPTWIGELAALLDSLDRGITHKDALATLKANPGLSSSAGEKGFYNAVARLEKNHRLIKHGGLLYSPRVVAALAERGEPLPDISPEMRRRAGGSAAVALEVLRAHPDGLDAMRLREELGKLPAVPESVTKHSHYIYNVLATLIGQGEVAKDETGVYKAIRSNA